MNKSVSLSALVIAASVSTNAFAQGSGTTQTTQLEPIIVSAGISPVAADEYGRSHTVITRDDIEERGYATVQEALEAQPGISMNGDAPSNRQIRIRGGEGSHTLILIDGVRAAAGDSEYIFRGLDTSYIERIEILRGPQSVPYGTDASTGVINIVTQQADTGFNAGAAVEIGEGDAESAYIAYGDTKTQVTLNISNRYDRGFDYSGDGGESDSSRWQSITTKGSFNLTRRLDTGFTYRIADVAYDLDENADGFGGRPSSDNESDYVFDDPSESSEALERAGSGYIEYRPHDQITSHRVSFNRTSNQSDTVTDDVTEVASYRLQYSADRVAVAKSRQLLSLLVERKTDRGGADLPDRQTDSVAVEYTGWLADDWSAQVGVRHDFNESFSDVVSWNVASSYFLANDIRLHASGGRAIVNPSFFEFTGGTSRAFNADLEPEENQGFDIGVEVPLSGLSGSVGVTYFKETLTNEISSDDLSAPFTYENDEGESDREGVELAASIAVNPSLDLRGNYTYLDATNADGSIEVRRPRNELSLGLTWRARQIPVTINGDLRHVRGLYDTQFWEPTPRPTEELPSFTTVDLSGQLDVLPGLTLTGRVTNLTDEENKEVWGYATRGRAGFVGVRASW
ncbi:TonB-dependent receptor [Spiribacter sp. 218]|uniref:TonB-dependent receptor plug domain-containing protein n=1 Tax=Spiribacter pallidus TaxID=1987936 RepID=UPI00349F11E3